MKYDYAGYRRAARAVDGQVRALSQAARKKVFREMASGAQLRRLVDQLVTRLDRLARSTRDLLNTLATVTGKEAGSLGNTWADTSTSNVRLMLTGLGGMAEFERDLIRTRTIEGGARAVKRGQRMRRPPKLTPHQQREASRRRESGEESLAEIGHSFNVNAATISRLTALTLRKP
jgi:DNA invertase Pin-like site-specific DNA recombinase